MLCDDSVGSEGHCDAGSRRTLLISLPLAILLLLFSPVPSPPILAGDEHPLSFAEPRSDMALVYFIRTGRMSGAAGTMYLYADQTFLGVMDNGTYGYAYVEPGRRLLWVVWGNATRELEFVPGQTYYLDVWQEIGVLDEARGREMIQKVGQRVTPTEEEMEKSAKHIRKKYSDKVEIEAMKEKAAVEEVAAPPQPESTEGMLRVPAYTAVTLELLETVTSEFSPTGSAVRFLVAEDASVDGQAFAGRGTIVEGIVQEAGQAGGLGKAGVLEVVVPFLAAIDGTKVPLVAQLAAAGKGREDVAAGFGLGLLPGLAVRGREAFYVAGDPFRVWTRAEVWVKPGAPPAAAGAGPAAAEGTEPGGGAGKEVVEDGAEADALTVNALGPELVRFNPRKGYAPDDLKIPLAVAAEPSQVEVHAVGGMVLSSPVKAERTSRERDGWVCVFDGWSVVRFMRPGQGGDAPVIGLRGRLADGRPFTARAVVDFIIEP